MGKAQESIRHKVIKKEKGSANVLVCAPSEECYAVMCRY